MSHTTIHVKEGVIHVFPSTKQGEAPRLRLIRPGETKSRPVPKRILNQMNGGKRR